MKRDSRSPEHYIESVDGELKTLLQEVRKLIFEVDPDAEEIIEYDMLGYTDFANLAAQKHYVSLYIYPRALAEFKKAHPKANCGKCCLRFRSMAQFDEVDVKGLLKDVKHRREKGEDVNSCD